ncbi:hypothetical protein [Allorhodopirellula solitaria]|uniref:Uncharacterized protein n=1 Tax=Allorhodopirellula solitaria TaxID=2527987 RepID=A0A5C5YJ62_9BACT|nr:hypothetical protein [Allorhodopirellula solitaria]TWT74900.1 hypothetical protein CA85_01880 [Allorhodopirellula solitaria]
MDDTWRVGQPIEVDKWEPPAAQESFVTESVAAAQTEQVRKNRTLDPRIDFALISLDFRASGDKLALTSAVANTYHGSNFAKLARYL